MLRNQNVTPQQNQKKILGWNQNSAQSQAIKFFNKQHTPLAHK
jgi:hypothetical protein